MVFLISLKLIGGKTRKVHKNHSGSVDVHCRELISITFKALETGFHVFGKNVY